MSHQRLLLASLLVAWVAMVLACGGAGQNADRQDVAKKIGEANSLWDRGDKAGAVVKYKAIFTEAYYPDDKGKVLPRIVEFETKAGNSDEAKTWMKRGLDHGVKVEYTDPLEKELFAAAKKERDEAAEEARKKKEAAVEKVTRANYNRIRDGMTLAEVQGILGPGKESASGQGVLIATWQSELTPFGSNVVSVTFQNGVVVGKAFAP